MTRRRRVTIASLVMAPFLVISFAGIFLLGDVIGFIATAFLTAVAIELTYNWEPRS